MSMRIPLVALVAIGLYMSSCTEGEDTLIDPGFAYFQFNQDSYVEYEVDSIVYDTPVNVLDTFHYYIKEKIDSLYFDLQNRPTARIERSRKNNLSDPWVVHDIWISNRTNTTAEKVEENVRFVKMAYPVSEESIWDGNAQNSLPEAEYHYVDIEEAKNIGGIEYSNTCRVIQKDLDNAIEREYAEEIFAYDVGMVYQRRDALELEVIVGDSVYSEIVRGTKFRMTAIGYGLEE